MNQKSGHAKLRVPLNPRIFESFHDLRLPVRWKFLLISTIPVFTNSLICHSYRIHERSLLKTALSNQFPIKLSLKYNLLILSKLSRCFYTIFEILNPPSSPFIQNFRNKPFLELHQVSYGPATRKIPFDQCVFRRKTYLSWWRDVKRSSPTSEREGDPFSERYASTERSGMKGQKAW